MKKQVEGRSLVPPLRNPKAGEADRTLFTHVGRWPKGATVDDHAYNGYSGRVPHWHLVSVGKAKGGWELFDLTADPGERTDAADKHPGVVKKLDAEYDARWAALPPYRVNQDAAPPKENPFKELCGKQFGKPKRDYRSGTFPRSRRGTACPPPLVRSRSPSPACRSSPA